MAGSALVVGASGIVGNNLARHLHQRGWQVYGLARRPPAGIEGVLPVAADLLDPESLRVALQSLRPTDVFINAGLRQTTEAENIKVNRAMVRNVLDALAPAGSVRHVALVTGLKHYLGPFEAYGTGTLPATPFREEQPRLDLENFYYAQEDELFAAATRHHFTWSVTRPPPSSPSFLKGPQSPPPPAIRPSTSSMATSSDGVGCGRASPPGSASKRLP